MRQIERVEKKSTKTHYKILERNSNGKIILQRLVNGSKSDNTLVVDDLNAFKVIREVKDTVLFFDDEYDFLSNLFEDSVLYDGREYPSAEHAFQASKTNKDNEKEMILTATSPTKAKVLGKRFKVDEIWEKKKDIEMYNICLSKFKNNDILKEKLLNTGNLTLINGNTGGDNYWGALVDKDSIEGENKLGKILMQIRNELREETSC